MSVVGYSLFDLPIQTQIHHGNNDSLIQQLHDQSFYLNTSGRRNNECDLIECDFPASVRNSPFIHYTIHRTIELISQVQNVSFTIDDLTFVTEGKGIKETIGLLLALGFTGLLRQIPFNLLKLKLRYCQLTQWKEDLKPMIRSEGEVIYPIESAVG